MCPGARGINRHTRILMWLMPPVCYCARVQFDCVLSLFVLYRVQRCWGIGGQWPLISLPSQGREAEELKVDYPHSSGSISYFHFTPVHSDIALPQLVFTRPVKSNALLYLCA